MMADLQGQKWSKWHFWFFCALNLLGQPLKVKCFRLMKRSRSFTIWIGSSWTLACNLYEMSILFFFGFHNVSLDKQDTGDILQSCASVLMQIIMADNIICFRLRKNALASRALKNFWWNLHQCNYDKWAFSKHIRFYLTTKHLWFTAANCKNSTKDFRSVTLKTLVLFALFSLKGEKLTTFFSFTGCNIVYVKHGVDFVVMSKVQAFWRTLLYLTY